MLCTRSSWGITWIDYNKLILDNNPASEYHSIFQAIQVLDQLGFNKVYSININHEMYKKVWWRILVIKTAISTRLAEWRIIIAFWNKRMMWCNGFNSSLDVREWFATSFVQCALASAVSNFNWRSLVIKRHLYDYNNVPHPPSSYNHNTGSHPPSL